MLAADLAQGDADMRLVFTPARPYPQQPASSLLRILIDCLVQADARHRERCRLETLPEERLRDMGLHRPVGAQNLEHRSSWS